MYAHISVQYTSNKPLHIMKEYIRMYLTMHEMCKVIHDNNIRMYNGLRIQLNLLNSHTLVCFPVVE